MIRAKQRKQLIKRSIRKMPFMGNLRLTPKARAKAEKRVVERLTHYGAIVHPQEYYLLSFYFDAERMKINDLQKTWLDSADGSVIDGEGALEIK